MHAAGGAVGDRRARQRRLAARAAARGVEVAAEREVVQVVPGPAGGRPGLPVARRRAVDDARVRARDVLVRDAEPRHDAGPVALEHHVGLRGEREERVAPLRRLQVDARLLPAAPRAVRPERGLGLHAGLPRRRADLHHARPVVREQPRAPRPRPDRREVEHGDPREGAALVRRLHERSVPFFRSSSGGRAAAAR